MLRDWFGCESEQEADIFDFLFNPLLFGLIIECNLGSLFPSYGPFKTRRLCAYYFLIASWIGTYFSIARDF